MSDQPAKRREEFYLKHKAGDVVTIGEIVIRFRAKRLVMIERPADQVVQVEHREAGAGVDE